MVRDLLVRGMLVGILAGLLAFGFARVFGEPQVDRAIAFEAQMDKAKGDMPEPGLVSRPVQAGLGLFTGVVVYGAAMGGLFALVFAAVYGRVGRLGARGTAALLALAAYIAVFVVPDLKYPSSPPSVGNPDTIGYRTALFFIMVAVSVAALVLAVATTRGLAARWGTWNAALGAAALFLALIAVAQILLPAINEVPDQFSAVVLWRFRIAALGIQAVQWTVIGLLFGALAEGVLTRRSAWPRSALRA
jgi:hypothetical protein